MTRIRSLFPLFILLILTVTSCSYQKRNILFKTPKKIHTHELIYIQNTTKSDSIVVDTTPQYKHRIKPGDRLNIRFLQNYDIGQASGQSATSTANDELSGAKGYLVNYDSTVTLPIVGRVNLVGKTRLEAAKILERLYGKTTTDPIIDVNIASLSVNVLGDVGNPGKIYLDKEDTRLVEVIAIAGGFKDGSKKNKVQIIRDGEIIQVDMQKIGSAFDQRTIIHDNDIVYVLPYGIKADMEPITVTSSAISPILTVLQITVISVQLFFILKATN